MISLTRTGMECSGCPLAPRRWRYTPQGIELDQAVYGAGSYKSGLAFIAEAPGDAEVAQGMPLVGPTGWWFKNVLADGGVNYDEVWRENALLCQPPGKGSELKGHNWKAVDHCRGSLWRQMDELVERGIRVFVPMGAAAWLAVSPHSEYTITQARGYVFPGPHGTWIVPTLHPSPKNLKGSRDGWNLVANDVRKAARIAAHGVHPIQTKRILSPTLTHVFVFFSGSPRPMTVDVENTRDGRLVCLGACDGDQTIVIPFLHQYGSMGIGLKSSHVQDTVRAWLARPIWKKRFQNGVHDTTILEQQEWMDGAKVEGWDVDTMLADHACWPDQRHSLHKLGSVYHDGPPWKPAAKRTETTESEETK